MTRFQYEIGIAAMLLVFFCGFSGCVETAHIDAMVGKILESPNQKVIVSRIISVYDGDTFKCDIGQWPDIIGKSISIRLLAIDAPEIRSSDKAGKLAAYASRDFLKKKLTSGSVVELREVRRGKYFRIVADVFIDGVSVNEQLLESGFAVPYVY